LEFVLRSTYFQYDELIYEQQDGAAMGSPVSAVLANLYMEDFEEEALSSAPCIPLIWKRYIDDTFTILSRDNVNRFYNTSTVNNRPSVSQWKLRIPYSLS